MQPLLRSQRKHGLSLTHISQRDGRSGVQRMNRLFLFDDNFSLEVMAERLHVRVEPQGPMGPGSLWITSPHWITLMRLCAFIHNNNPDSFILV